MKKALYFLFIIGFFFLGRLSVPKPQPIEIEKVVTDTIRYDSIQIDTMWLTRTEKVYLHRVDTFLIHDTTLVEIPIYTYIAKDSLYYIEIDGFGVDFKRIEVYPKTLYITEEKVSKIANKWGLGVHLGFGVNQQGLYPYLGLGVSYNFLTW